MSSDGDAIEIAVCLGSSCFARGNSHNLGIIEDYLQKRGMKAVVRLTGRLCQEECKQGPNISINGAVHHEVTAAALRELLQQVERSIRNDHGPA